MNRGRAAGVILIFLVWAVIFTYPLVLHLGDSVILSGGGDVYLHLWDLWWADKSLIDLHQSPFHTTYLYYPTGVSLYYHSLYLIALWRILESPGKPWQPGGGGRATICAGLALACASLATWYFTAGLALFTVVFVPLYIWNQRRIATKRPDDEKPTTSTLLYT